MTFLRTWQSKIGFDCWIAFNYGVNDNFLICLSTEQVDVLSLQYFPVLPAGHLQVPSTGSHRASSRQRHRWAHLLPYEPFGQTKIKALLLRNKVEPAASTYDNWRRSLKQTRRFAQLKWQTWPHMETIWIIWNISLYLCHICSQSSLLDKYTSRWPDGNESQGHSYSDFYTFFQTFLAHRLQKKIARTCEVYADFIKHLKTR